MEDKRCEMEGSGRRARDDDFLFNREPKPFSESGVTMKRFMYRSAGSKLPGVMKGTGGQKRDKRITVANPCFRDWQQW